MVQEKHPEGKVLIIGGGIANFTNVAATFRGIITALREFQQRLIDHKISIFVRRAGPNYQEGLRRMREVGQTLGKLSNFLKTVNHFLLLFFVFRYTGVCVWTGKSHDRNMWNSPRKETDT